MVPTCLVAVLPGMRVPTCLSTWGREVGVDIVAHDVAFQGHLLELGGDATLLVIGGAISPYDTRALPAHDLGRLLAKAVSRQTPVLGIGGGAHLLAWALGGRPSVPDTPVTAGWRTVTRTAQGQLDRLFTNLPSSSSWIEASHLAFTSLPIDSEVLAVDDAGMAQAVRFGPGAWGLQGHPCLDSAAWASLSPLTEDDPALAASVEENDYARLEAMCAAWKPLFTAFFGLAESASGG